MNSTVPRAAREDDTAGAAVSLRFSVITVTYNAEKVLGRTLESIASQTWPDVEHIIIDGASTDRTLAIARQYIKDNRIGEGSHDIILQSEPDGGLYDAMNKGLRRATGHYVVFINAGDCLHEPDTLWNIVKQVGHGDLPAVVYGDTDITDGEGNFLFRRAHRPPERLSWRSFRKGMLVCHQAFYARGDIARRLPYDLNYRHSADVDWCIRVMKEAEKRGLPLVNTRLTLADYMREGQSTVFHRASLGERFAVMRHHYGMPTTVIMHVWFVFRALWRKIRRGAATAAV